QFVISYNSVHSADFQGVVGTLLGAAGNPLDSVVHADQTRHAYGAAKARVDAQLGFRQTDLGALGHDAEVTGQTHFQTTTQCQAIDGSDRGHVQVFEGIENLVGFQAAGHQFFFRQLEGLDELGDIGADDEHVLAAGNDDARDAAVG